MATIPSNHGTIRTQNQSCNSKRIKTTFLTLRINLQQHHKQQQKGRKIMRRKSWLKLFICRKNLPLASNHSTPRKTTGSEDNKLKRISRQTSFQQLCSIIISEAHPDEDIKGFQESDHNTVYHVTEDHLGCSNRLQASADAADPEVVSSAADDDSSSSLAGDHVIVVLDDQMDNASQSSSADVDSEIEHIILNGETVTAIEEQIQEYAPAFIQIALRRFLAEKDPGEQRKAAGLVGAVKHEGHFAAQKPIAAIRIIRRMHKMQNLLKNRNTCLLTTKRSAQRKRFRNSRGPGIYGAKPNQSSMIKLLSKLLGHELAVSTLEMKPVLHGCDAERLHLSEEIEKPYSLWQWLERWLAHTSSNPQHLRSYNSSEASDEDQEANLPEQEEKTVLPGTEIPIPFSPNADAGLSAIEHEGYQFHTSSVRMKIQIPLSSIDIEVDSFTINGKDQYEQNKGAVGTEDSMTVFSNSSQVPSESATTLDYNKSDNVELENEVPEVSSDRTFFDCVETEVKSPVKPRSGHNQAASRRTRRVSDHHSKDTSMDSTNESFGSALSASHSVEINIETISLVEYSASHDSGFKLDFIANNSGTDATPDSESTYMTKESTCLNSNGRLDESKEKKTSYTANVEHYSTVTATSNIYKKSVIPTQEIGPSPRGSSPRMHVVVPESQGATSTQFSVSAKISKS